ncbi:phosphotransferase family protein [Stutzerimonas tarimensis]|uniref:Phosphotransferase family protein n=1 Tax=Stutzerimonas tarimensis TaxID=1507735 RepID=A0ABV7T974_9GAMM
MSEEIRSALEHYVARRAEAHRVVFTEFRLLSGGAIQQNWLATAQVKDGPHQGLLELVIRADAPTGVAVSHGRAQEFALLQAVFEVGVTVPEPLWLDASGEAIGRPLFVMRRVAGQGAGHLLVKDLSLAPDRPALARRLGEELAKIHRIRPPHPALEFLPLYDEAPALHAVADLRAWLDGHDGAHPVLEWGLRWLELNAPESRPLVLCHRDFRTGNYMVDAHGLTAILDWEFAGWSDPLEDLGWFCAACWRFGRDNLEAGGIGHRSDFYAGYESVSGTPIPREQVGYWEVLAHLRWAVIALQQADRHLSGEEDSLLLALTGHLLPELELAILQMTEAA